MDYTDLPPALKTFVDDTITELDSSSDESVFLPKLGESLKTLVAKDDWLDPVFCKEHPEYYQQFLLYVDPNERFSVVSLVWGPGQKTPIHDHTVWGIIGMLRGSEYDQAYKISEDGTPKPVGKEALLQAGQVAFVSPTIGDIHQVRNADTDKASISIHVYGADIGKVNRHVFPIEGGTRKDFVSGYTN